MWQRVVEALERARRFVLTTHVNSDGDGIGSELALGRTLSRMGKEVSILNPTATQPRYDFLLRDGEITRYEPRHEERIAQADVIVVLDINRWHRLGEMTEPIRRSRARKICIDHHPDPEPFGELDVIRPEVSATGMLIYDLLRELGHGLPDEVVDPLYVAVLTDTGGFRFQNTNRGALLVAAELVRRGARPDDLYRRVYETSSPDRMRLLGETLCGLSYEVGGALVHFTLTDEMFRRCNVDRDDAEGFTDIVRLVNGSEVVLAFIETQEGGTKVSLRSKRDALDVSEIAQQFGGGGHVNASGITDPRPLAIVRREVLDSVRQKLLSLRES